MTINQFTENRTDCHVLEDKVMLWKITSATDIPDTEIDGGGRLLVVHLLVTSGSLIMDCPNHSHHLTPGCFGDFIDVSSFRLHSVSRTMTAYLMAYDGNYAQSLFKGSPPFPFTYILDIRQQPVMQFTPADVRLLSHRMDIVCETCSCRDHPFRNEMVTHAIRMLIMDIAYVYRRTGGTPADNGRGRTAQVFADFVRMLPAYVCTERTVSFYASKLCISPQYLNRVVKNVSGKTASEWISHHLTGEISAMLDNGNHTMQQIAAHTGFPDQATLTKYFKRYTGCTPTEYRRKTHSASH